MADDDLRAALGRAADPVTGRTLDEEGRGVVLEVDGDVHRVSWFRDGLDLAAKKKVEDAFYRTLGERGVGEDDVVVMSRSRSPKGAPAPAAAPPPAPSDSPPPGGGPPPGGASLKTGHGPPVKERRRVPGVGRLLAVASGKGGVGKSTVAVNLACALAARGRRVGLVDADIHGPSLPMMLGRRDGRPGADGKGRILPLEAHGVSFVSFGSFVPEKDPVIWRGPMLGGVLRQFLFDVDWGGRDVLLVDLPPGTGDVPLSLSQLAELDGAVVVTTPQEVALSDAVKGLGMLRQVGVEVLGIVENMSHFTCGSCGGRSHPFGRGGGERAARELGTAFLGGLPLEDGLAARADGGVPHMADPSLEGDGTWRAYVDIAEKVDRMVFKERGLLGRLFRRRGT